MTDQPETPAEAPAEAPAKSDLVLVTTVKAFLTPTGWVQSGEKIKVNPTRKRELLANGLIEGTASAATDGALTSEPLGAGKSRSRKLHVGGGAGAITPEEGDA